MKQMSLSKVAIAASTFTFATLLSFGWCEQRGVSLSVESAQARIGRPLTPHALPALRVATTGGLRTATVPVWSVLAWRPARTMAAMALAAITALMAVTLVAITALTPLAAILAAITAATRTAATSPDGQRCFRATTAGETSALRSEVVSYGYSGWDDYQARNGIVRAPGTLVKADNGLTYPCQ